MHLNVVGLRNETDDRYPASSILHPHDLHIRKSLFLTLGKNLFAVQCNLNAVKRDSRI